LPASAFRNSSNQDSDAIALIDGTDFLTYAQLNVKANKLANRLHKLGAGPDIFVGICMERKADWLFAMLAVLKSVQHMYH